MNRIVVLGPQNELHPGVHGSLIDFPPTGVQYSSVEEVHRFTYSMPIDNPDPFVNLAIQEEIFYNLGQLKIPPIGVHSSKIPVGNSIPWIVDADDLIGTICFGKTYILGHHGPGYITEQQALVRQSRMINKFAHPDCVAILFRSNFARIEFLKFLSVNAEIGPQVIDSIESKTDIIFPTMPAVPPRRLGPEDPIRILYVGRTYEDKGGQTALAVFQRLHEEFGSRVQFVWVGEFREEYFTKYPFIDFNGFLNRRAYFKLLEHCQVFFSPTCFESYGMAIVEAQCLGLAIVTTKGIGMEHIEEIVRNGRSAYLIDNSQSTNQKVTDFSEALSKLVSSADALNRMRWESYALTSAGVLSTATRDKRLLKYYHELIFRSGSPLNKSSWPLHKSNEHALDIDTHHLIEEAARRSQGRPLRINIHRYEIER